MKTEKLIFYLTLLGVLLTTGLRAQSTAKSSSVGGYGELHYNIDQTNNTKVLDFHRFVLFYYHRWTEKWSFIAEVELEHNFVKDGHGELELEQAYVDYQASEIFGFRAGVVLPSVGLINETHEPPTFLSVERPAYAKNIIPTTWFGNGIAVYGDVGKFAYKFTAMEGLNADNFKAKSGIRDGRQKGYKANVNYPLYNASLNYTGVSGFKIGLSYTLNEAFSDSINNQINLLEFHARWNAHNIISVFEYGTIGFDQGDVKMARGYYFDFGYNIGSFLGINTEIIPWFRWTDYNTVNDSRNGAIDTKAHHYKKWLAGITIKPIPPVVFKIDFGTITHVLDNTKTKIMNLGAGYMF